MLGVEDAEGSGTDRGPHSSSEVSATTSKLSDSTRLQASTPEWSSQRTSSSPGTRTEELGNAGIRPAHRPPTFETQRTGYDTATPEDSEDEDDGDGYVTASEGEEELKDAAPVDDAPAAEAKPATQSQTASPHPRVRKSAAPTVVSARRPLGKPMSTLTAADVALTSEDIKDDIRIIWEAL